MRIRLVTSAAALAGAAALVLGGASTAAAGDGPSVTSRTSAGISVGGLLDIGAKSGTSVDATPTGKLTVRDAGVGANSHAGTGVNLGLGVALGALLGVNVG